MVGCILVWLVVRLVIRFCLICVIMVMVSLVICWW